MRVLMLVGFAFEGAVERDREIQLVRSDNLAGAALESSSAALDQLHYRDAGNRDQLQRHRFRQSGQKTPFLPDIRPQSGRQTDP